MAMVSSSDTENLLCVPYMTHVDSNVSWQFTENHMEYLTHARKVCTRPSPFLGGAWVLISTRKFKANHLVLTLSHQQCVRCSYELYHCYKVLNVIGMNPFEVKDLYDSSMDRLFTYI